MRTPVDDLPPAFAGPRSGVAGRNATILFLSALTIMAGATISPALPAIEAHFADTPEAAILTRLVLTIPALFIALCAPFAGLFADHYGRRKVAIAAILLYGVAGVSGIFANSLLTLLAGRALLGVAVAGVMTVATALVGDYFSGSARDRFMGQQAAFIGIGGLFFLTGGGLLAEFNWRAPFLVYAVAFALVPAILAFITDVRRPALQKQDGKSLSPGFFFTIPLAAILLAAVLNSLTFYLMPTQLPFHLRALGTDSPILVGVAMGACTLASALLSFFYGDVRRRLDVSAVFALGFGILAAGLALVAAAGSFAAILPASFLVGSGLGLIMPNLGSAAMAIAGEDNRGRVAGLLTASIFLGQFVSPLISQPMAERTGYATMFGFGAATLLAAALAALCLAGIRYRRQLA